MIWDLETRKAKTTIEGPESPAIVLTFAPDGTRVACAWAYANTVKIIDAPSGKIVGEVKTLFPTCVAFSPDGRTLAVGSLDSTISLWEIPNKRQASR